jgi:hypothetical protein
VGDPLQPRPDREPLSVLGMYLLFALGVIVVLWFMFD